MNLMLTLIAVLILGSAAVAVLLRNLIHSALLLVVSWFGIAGFYLWAGAEFVAFAQVLVYVGAISMVVLFAVLLTRQPGPGLAVAQVTSERGILALLAGSAVFAVLAAAVLQTNFPAAPAPVSPGLTVLELGQQLMGLHRAAVLVIGVMLTVSLVGAVVLASHETANKEDAS
jgi:NADH:ubiquinone oxidoreductase subunit 6 (subunit J)